jgi:hypothetical protein
MSRESGILVVDRFDLMRRGVRAGVLASRRPALSVSTEEVFRRYRGFDGVAWPELDHPAFPIVEGLAAVSEYLAVKEYAGRLPGASRCDVLLLADVDADVAALGMAGWESVGIDVGFFESEWSHYSVLLNEVLFGVNPELRSYSARLNQHLLLRARSDAEELLSERQRLAGLGRDLESVSSMEAIAIMLPGAGVGRKAS